MNGKRKRAAGIVGLGLIVGGLAGSGRAAELATLQRWEAPAVLLPNRGPGESYFRLVAVVSWSEDAPRSSTVYRVRVELPDGGQVEQAMDRDDAPRSRTLNVYVPARAVLDRMPDRVRLRAWVTGPDGAVSNALEATIDDFPRPTREGPPPDRGPFGWGEALRGSSGSGPAALPRPGPTGLRFIRLPVGPNDDRAVFLADSEATNQQVAAVLRSWAPPSMRSDEFALEAPEQPAFGLTPKQAEAYLAALGRSDPAGIVYRLPTVDEWLTAARAGRASGFWWGPERSYPAGANLLGPEPALATDTTAPAVERPGATTRFEANPWGFRHTFGNVAEWAQSPAGPVRLGGHFRTDPEAPAAEPAVVGPDATGEDLFVGIRPAFELTAAAGTELASRRLRADAGLSGITARYDLPRDVAILTGRVAEPAIRRRADAVLGPLWWLAAVENRVSTPEVAPGKLVELGPIAGPFRRKRTLARILDTFPVRALWADPLPVSGSRWYVNVQGGGGGTWSYPLPETELGKLRPIEVVLDRSRIAVGTPARLWLSLGGPADTPGAGMVVSNVLPIR